MAVNGRLTTLVLLFVVQMTLALSRPGRGLSPSEGTTWPIQKSPEILPFPSLLFLISWRQDFRRLLNRPSTGSTACNAPFHQFPAATCSSHTNIPNLSGSNLPPTFRTRSSHAPQDKHLILKTESVLAGCGQTSATAELALWNKVGLSDRCS
ncbi:hypothetical protein L873DRAFT_1457013 [Choiromyces venosus 120613-1]|uniref:Uncharacterized protein n=1 Tax=Choiromyces venosus 120613-1 TaxID=1336337 RepID=A0A3N4K1P5_9PEZI|nr:hypothetical protein L873DRAFT_1457013 [Choiromyces venosus 120613-1]